MSDIAVRYQANPILTPADVTPSQKGLQVACLLNPGAFEYDGKIWLLLRVAERPQQRDGVLSFPIIKDGQIEIIQFAEDDPDLDASDPREIKYKGIGYITTLSHLRLASSEDGIRFSVHDDRCLWGTSTHENYGIEDCRVTHIGETYYSTYTAVSAKGYGIGMQSTKDWRRFDRFGMIISGPNKDCALFSEPIQGKYYCLHRPSMVIVGGNDIWIGESENLRYWGNHRCIAQTRPGMWDSERIGAGATPIKTEYGWLEIYHGADHNRRYCLGALLLDLRDPSKVLARSDKPIMEPTADYEKTGFFGNVIFTNGHVVMGDDIFLYYGAADRVICGAKLSVLEILKSLGV